ncbi:hypothetical protein NECAME_14443 [Necator americanus]|uniref:Uncharacterized protein n=1 Tax=Necator americanus TaxID=51031 RepID=W2SQ02_NECAM|nr:hypothetical protein NECAME_14443 [Necator americanus]ETN70956.1 hypothetical protein NECAME_14443 [Necator americanus]
MRVAPLTKRRYTLYDPSGATSSAKHSSTRQDRGFSFEEQLFMMYMKQHPEIISNLGLKYPSAIQRAMEDLQWKHVELRLVDGGSPVLSQSPRQGRFLKKSQTASSNHIRKVDVPPAEKRIGSMIKYEMMQLREREDELQKSRRALGLPSLEETMELWRQGNSDTLSYRSTASYSRMNELPTAPLHKNPQLSELSSTNGSWDY